MSTNLYLYGMPFERAVFKESIAPENYFMLFLQYLPLLFLEENERALVTCLPEKRLALAVLEEEVSCGSTLYPWGHTKGVVEFAKRKKLSYKAPPLELVEKISSKLFSHGEFPFESSFVAYSVADILKMTAPFILKSPFGFSARETRLFKRVSEEEVHHFAAPYFDKGEALLVEPWVERCLDFSSQWSFEEEGLSLLGLTEVLNTARGSYLGTHLREGDLLKSYEKEHLDLVRPALEQLHREGFRGALGVDAFLYLKEGKERLRAVVEINPRSTMSRPLLLLRKKLKDSRPLTLHFKEEGRAILPEALIDQRGKKISCKKQLFLLD